MPWTELSYLRALFDSFPTGVLLANDAACYVAANQAACTLLGRSRAEVIGLHLSELVAADRREEVDLQWQAFLRDGEQTGVFTIELPDGTPRTLSFHARAHFVPGVHSSFITAVPTLDSVPPGDSSVTTMCAWTKKVRVGQEWHAIERFLGERLGLRVSHGMAPEVYERLSRGLSAAPHDSTRSGSPGDNST